VTGNVYRDSESPLLEYIFESPSHINHLELKDFGGGFTPKGVTTFTNSLGTRALTKLVLHNVAIGRGLLRGLRNSGITSLSIRHIKELDVNALSDLISKTTLLRSLDLGNNKINFATAPIIAAALVSSNVTTLNLEQNQLRNMGVYALVAAILSSNLVAINLDGNGVGYCGRLRVFNR
jgi:Ran GTPase-activating protein (RanGAP) involved in mRNA processing and transport